MLLLRVSCTAPYTIRLYSWIFTEAI
uniref:Uncharacterized protein n=1 Tax=Anguilla anguilla TaxID=7936 RepID=A0A0E9TVT2_ANGAN